MLDFATCSKEEMADRTLATNTAGKQPVADFSVERHTDTESGPSQPQKLPFSRRLMSIMWDSLDKTPEERRFVLKADIWIMSYVCFAYFVKYLDQTNVCAWICPL